MDAYYAVLGLTAGASCSEVKRAYYSLARVAHPDKGGDADYFKQVLNAYEKLCSRFAMTIRDFCREEGYTYHTFGDTACDPAMMDWVIGDSSIRTSKTKGTSHINYELFENWKQHPNRGSAITMVCCDGKELPSILEVLDRVAAMKNLLVVWQGNEYDKSYKNKQFGQYRDDLAGKLQTLEGHMSRAHDARLVALAPNAVWQYGREFADFERCAWPLVFEQFADSTTLLARGEEFGNLQPFLHYHVAATKKQELADLINFYLLGTWTARKPPAPEPQESNQPPPAPQQSDLNEDEHFEMLDRPKRHKIADLMGDSTKVNILIAANGSTPWPESVEAASVEWVNLLKTMLEVTKSKSTKNVANKESGWNRFLGVKENWSCLIDALITKASANSGGDESPCAREPTNPWKDTTSGASSSAGTTDDASELTNPWKDTTSGASSSAGTTDDASELTNPWEDMTSGASELTNPWKDTPTIGTRWADIEDVFCNECRMMVPWVYCGRGPFQDMRYCKDCWGVWLWNTRY